MCFQRPYGFYAELWSRFARECLLSRLSSSEISNLQFHSRYKNSGSSLDDPKHFWVTLRTNSEYFGMCLFLCKVILTPWTTWESKVTCHLPTISFPVPDLLALDQYWNQFLLYPQMDGILSLTSHTHMPHTQHQKLWFLDVECRFYVLNRFIEPTFLECQPCVRDHVRSQK